MRKLREKRHSRVYHPISRIAHGSFCLDADELRVRSSRPALETIRSDPSAPEILRRSANYSLALIAY